MTLPRTAAEVLAEHVTLEVACVDRLYLNLYVPRLQRDLGVVGFFRSARGMPFASGAAMEPITRAFVAAILRYAAVNGVDIVDFAKGQRKDDVAAEYLARYPDREGILFIGRAQEKTSLWTTRKRRNPTTGATYPWLVRDTRVVNHFYFYGRDAEVGPFFIKFCSYFPYTGRVCLNGHEYAKTQAAAAGVGFTALDNGFLDCDDPVALQDICNSFTPEVIERFVRRWLAELPNPFTAADRAAGFDYALSVLQAEFSLTQVVDRPLSGRLFFDDVIRHNLDLGRPDRVGLIFDRQVRRRGPRPTPGTFRTRVITDGVTPSLHVAYKHSKIKQYFKLGRALRTETTINDTGDFGIRRGLQNLPALRAVGDSANRRLLDVQRTSHDPAVAASVFASLTAPVLREDRRVAPGLRFGDDRTMALLACVLVCRTQVHGFRARDLRALLADALSVAADDVTAGAMTYRLRQLREHGLIARDAGSHRWRLTSHGLAVATAWTLAYHRMVMPGLAHLTSRATDHPLRTAFDRFADRSCLAA